MKFKVACHKPSSDSYFEDEVEISSAAFATTEEQVEAVRRIYDGATPPIEVLLVKELVMVERHCW